MKPYELIEHTADTGLKAYGKDLSEAFKNAAIGMFDIITDNSSKIDANVRFFCSCRCGIQ